MAYGDPISPKPQVQTRPDMATWPGAPYRQTAAQLPAVPHSKPGQPCNITLSFSTFTLFYLILPDLPCNLHQHHHDSCPADSLRSPTCLLGMLLAPSNTLYNCRNQYH